jgi:hypothetical protein
MILLSSYTKFLWMGDYGLKNILQDGCIRVYGGARPTTADAAESGTLLGLITQDAATFTPNVRADGALQLMQSGYGVLASSGNWRLTVTTSGLATWFRYNGNYADDQTVDTNKTRIRMDGDVGPSADLLLDQPNLTAGTVLPISFYLQFRNL